MAIPPIMVAAEASKCPAMAISTIPTKGTVILAKILGMASLRMERLMFISDICLLRQAYRDKKSSDRN